MRKTHIFCIALLSVASTRAVEPPSPCPVYVHESQDLECDCKFNGSDTLILKTVNRRDNGKQYECEVLQDNVLSKRPYTLQVAYGPSSDTMDINGSDSFVTDGSRNLTLKCTDKETNPAPSIFWLIDECNHGTEGSYCTFQPKPNKHQNARIKCRAVNAVTNEGAVKERVLRLVHPPPEKPLIKGHIPGQIHESGDELTCTVTGGEPLVSKVVFSCVNPPHEDQDDVKDTTSVSSSLTIDATKPKNESWVTVCTCSAEWDPEPGLYDIDATASFALRTERDDAKPKTSKDGGLSGTVIGGIAGGVLADIAIGIGITGVVIYMYIKKRRTKNRNDEEDSTERMTSNVAAKETKEDEGSGETKDEESTEPPNKVIAGENTDEEEQKPLTGDIPVHSKQTDSSEH